VSEGVSTFDYSMDEVIASKMELVGDGGDFLFLRKGEANGALEVAMYAAQLLDPEQMRALVSFLGNMGGVLVGAGASAFAANKLWEVGLDSLDRFFDNLSRSKDLIGGLQSRIAGARPGGVPEDFRVICSPTPENLLALPVLRKLGAQVRHRSDTADSGLHRFHVNSSRFVLNVRTPGPRYVGVRGSDAAMQGRLVELFLHEWEQCEPAPRITGA
jgi:hypothetical protein